MKHLNYLQTQDQIWRPWAFDRVTCEGKTESGRAVAFSIVGKCYSGYNSGPSLITLAEVAGEIFGPGFYGLRACRALGFRA